MIIKLHMEMEDEFGKRITYKFCDPENSDIVAVATNNIDEHIFLFYNDKKYELNTSPKIVEKTNFKLKYPISSKRQKTLGYNIYENETCITQYYGEAATCRKKWIFKRNIGFTVFKFEGKAYLLYKVGFADENSHYYCLYDENNTTVGIIERHYYYEDNCKATLYVEDKNNLLITLFACTQEIVFVPRDKDTSAGNYISLLREEKEMLDRSFIERVKALV